MKKCIKLSFLSIPPFSLSGISRWVDLTRFVTDFDFFFKRTILLLINYNFFNFGTNVSRRLPFITLLAIFPQNAAATHGKRAKSAISSNPIAGGFSEFKGHPRRSTLHIKKARRHIPGYFADSRLEQHPLPVVSSSSQARSESPEDFPRVEGVQGVIQTPVPTPLPIFWKIDGIFTPKRL